MTVVVDANILISAIINPNGTIPFLLFNTNDAIGFVAPKFIIEEIELHQSKIIAVANISTPTFTALFQALRQQLLIFSDDIIGVTHLEKACLLTKDIDEKDTIYVAFSLALEALFWTGDNKLKRALAKKGFNNAISTKQLELIINGLT